MPHHHPVNIRHHDEAPFSARAAERVAALVGSWRFIIAQTVVVIAWVAANLYLAFHFDPFPFILLNLAFSTQAAYTGPILLVAANRQATKDRERAEHTYE